MPPPYARRGQARSSDGARRLALGSADRRAPSSRMWSICSGSAEGIFAIPPTIWMTSAKLVSRARRRPACARCEERLAGGVERRRGSRGRTRRRGRRSASSSCGERLLGGEVADEPVQPARRAPPTAASRRGRRPNGTAPRPRRRRRPRAGPGGSGSGGRACRSRPPRGARSPRARSRCRRRRRPRARRRSASRSCAARRPAWGVRARQLGERRRWCSWRCFAHIGLTNRRLPPYSSGGILHLCTGGWPPL